MNPDLKSVYPQPPSPAHHSSHPSSPCTSKGRVNKASHHSPIPGQLRLLLHHNSGDHSVLDRLFQPRICRWTQSQAMDRCGIPFQSKARHIWIFWRRSSPPTRRRGIRWWAFLIPWLCPLITNYWSLFHCSTGSWLYTAWAIKGTSWRPGYIAMLSNTSP